MKQVEITAPIREFLKLVTPPGCKLVSLSAGPYDFEVGYIMDGVHRVVTWSAVSDWEID